jgi:SAM-dependent methyltransferase
MTEPGLDFAFLQFIGATPESQKRWQRFYVPQFAGCTRVLDLGCGSGDFLELLAEQGIAGFGVDADPQCCADARARGLTVAEQDVLDYLRTAAPEQFDGVFCAHLVEHLPYEAVLELVRGALRVLRPGGRVVLATPNARSLFAHLEMFHRHFGHVSFYHPELLRFFLQHAGFTQLETGTNASMARGAMWGGDLRGRVVRRGMAEAVRLPAFGLPYTTPVPGGPPVATGRVGAGEEWLKRAAPFTVPWFGQPGPAPAGPGRTVQFERSLPMPSDNALRRLVLRLKNFLARWLVLPYLDAIVPQVNERLQALDVRVNQTASASHAATNAAVAALANDLNRALSEIRAEINQGHSRTDELTRQINRELQAIYRQQGELHLKIEARVAGVNQELNQEISALNAVYEQVDRKLQVLAAELAGTADRLVDALETLDPPWECYALGVKPGGEATEGERDAEP